MDASLPGCYAGRLSAMNARLFNNAKTRRKGTKRTREYGAEVEDELDDLNLSTSYTNRFSKYQLSVEWASLEFSKWSCIAFAAGFQGGLLFTATIPGGQRRLLPQDEREKGG